MNLEKITLNECSNDGTKIYLYYLADVGMWISFGYSAFIVAHVTTKNGDMDYLESFSIQMQMPTVAINNKGLKKIVTLYEVDQENTGQYMITFDSNFVDAEAYCEWTSTLRGK